MSTSSIWIIAATDPGRTAVIAPDGRALTYGQLAARSNQLAHALRDLGLAMGDRVATVMRNGLPVVETVLAAMQSGLYLVPVNFHSTATDIAYIVEDSGARAVIADPAFADACTRALDSLKFAAAARFCTGRIDGFRSFQDWRDSYPGERPAETWAGAVMNYTSGTTGNPKGVLRPLRGVDADTGATRQSWILSVFGIGLGPGAHLVNSPLYHTAVVNLAISALHSGQTLVLMDEWDPESALRLVERYRVTSMHMVATHFHRLLSLPEEVRGRYDLGSLTHVIHGAVPTPVDIKQRMMDWWGPVIYEYYGSSEVGGTVATPQRWLAKPGTVGQPFTVTQIRILDDQGNPLPAGEAGWIYMCQGDEDFQYHNDPAKTAKNRRGRFICVGDIGYLDEDGDLFLCGRDAEIIISGGVNIYPAATEGHLLGHPAVADVAVVGVPDAEFGEQVKAVVVVRPGIAADAKLEQELIRYCRAGLSALASPKSVDFVDSLPRDPSGKLYKQRVRDGYWKDRDRRI